MGLISQCVPPFVFSCQVLVDPSLAPFFEGKDLARLRSHQRNFMTMAFGGPKSYSGRTMAAAHADMIKNQARPVSSF